MKREISVLISTYNNRRFVEKKLAEIKAQSIFDRAEFIFIETGSPERERELLEPFCEEHENCRLITTDDRQTLYAAWNLGWEATSAEIVCNSNMDDCMHPRLLENVVGTMKNKAADVCTVLIAKQFDKDRWNDWSIDHVKGLELSLRPGPFTAWKRELKDTIGMFDANYTSAGDKDFWARIVANGLRFELIKLVLYLYTKSDDQLSKVNANADYKVRDRELMASKPYPLVWSYALRRQIFWRRYLFSCFPRLYWVAP